MSNNNNEPVMINLIGSTDDVEDGHIANGTKDNYAAHLVNFMLFLFAEYPEKLVYKEKLEEASVGDGTKKTKPLFRKECKKQLKAMKRQKKNPPIHLGIDGKRMNYKVIKYLFTS